MGTGRGGSKERGEDRRIFSAPIPLTCTHVRDKAIADAAIKGSWGRGREQKKERRGEDLVITAEIGGGSNRTRGGEGEKKG